MKHRRRPGMKGLAEAGGKFPPDVSRDPFNTYDQNFKMQTQDPASTFAASPIAGAENLQRRAELSGQLPQAITLPPHLFIPEDAQSIDIRALWNVPPDTTMDLMTFNGRKGGLVYFIGYAVYFDALMFDLVNLVPLVNGVRVFPFHGNPDSKFKIGLGTGADLSNMNLISCQLELQPHDELVWRFTNNDVVDVAAGVRMSGYFTQGIERKTGRFGG